MPPTHNFDVFLSFADEDADFAWRWLLPRLEQAGVTVCSEADFVGGAVKLEEYERFVDSSRHVLLLISPSWIRGPWTRFASLVAQHDDPTNRRRKILPLLLQPGTALPPPSQATSIRCGQWR